MSTPAAELARTAAYPKRKALKEPLRGRFDVVVHFAGRKAVGESVTSPMLYYTHNLLGSINLVEAMRKHNCKNVRTHFASLRAHWCPCTAQTQAVLSECSLSGYASSSAISLQPWAPV